MYAGQKSAEKIYNVVVGTGIEENLAVEASGGLETEIVGGVVLDGQTGFEASRGE